MANVLVSFHLQLENGRIARLFEDLSYIQVSLVYMYTRIYVYIYISDDAINRKSYLGNTNICDDMDIRQFGYLPIRG